MMPTAAPAPQAPVRKRPLPVEMTATTTVAICTPTFRRPEHLTALLQSIRRMDRDGIHLHVFVVDNDADGSAKAVVHEALRGSGIPVTVDCVPERNLPVVRNRLMTLAGSIHPDWVWMLDDDQFVEHDALRRMLETANATDADCVVGRVPHTFEGSTEQWAQWSGIFDEVHRPTGETTKRFGTNGPLVRYAALKQVPGPFDPALKFAGGHHGGEDSDFFTRFRSMGFTAIGCDEAVIFDRLHASRNNPDWLTHRALRIGLIKGFLVREVDPSPRKFLFWVGSGAGYAVVNGLATLLTLPFGPSRSFKYRIRTVQGYGVVLGALTGRRFLRGKEPATTHGR